MAILKSLAVMCVLVCLATGEGSFAYEADYDVWTNDTGAIPSGDIWIRAVVLDGSDGVVSMHGTDDLLKVEATANVKNGGYEPAANAMTGASASLTWQQAWGTWTDFGADLAMFDLKATFGFYSVCTGLSGVGDACLFSGAYESRIENVRVLVDGIVVKSWHTSTPLIYSDALHDTDKIPHTGNEEQGNWDDYEETQLLESPTLRMEGLISIEGSWVGQNDNQGTHDHLVTTGLQLGPYVSYATLQSTLWLWLYRPEIAPD